MEELASLILGILLAWGIVRFGVPRRSNFTLNPWPLEYDDSNLMLIGVGLASPKPQPSVMDATPESAPAPVVTTPPVVVPPVPSPIPVAPTMKVVIPSPSPSVMAPSPLTLAPSPAPVMAPSPSS
jgi:hypothetical protein